VLYSERPLVLWHQDEDRERISSAMPWREQFDWLAGSRHLMTRRAYAALAMSVVSSMAATTRSAAVCRTVLRDARRHGSPRAIDYLTFAQIWLVPPRVRRGLRDRVLGRRAAAAPAPPVSARRAAMAAYGDDGR
jgi:hypothetical protein